MPCEAGGDRYQQPADDDADLEHRPRKFLENGVGVVQVGFLLPVHLGPIFGRVPVEEMLAPAHLLAGDVKAGQGADDGDGEGQRAGVHERIEQQSHGDRQSGERGQELRHLEHAVAFGNDTVRLEFRAHPVAHDPEHRDEDRNAEPPPRLALARIVRERAVWAERGGIGKMRALLLAT